MASTALKHFQELGKTYRGLESECPALGPGVQHTCLFQENVSAFRLEYEDVVVVNISWVHPINST